MKLELPAIRCPQCRTPLAVGHGFRTFKEAGRTFYVISVKCLGCWPQNKIKLRSMPVKYYRDNAGRPGFMDYVVKEIKDAVRSPEPGLLLNKDFAA
jgi:RNase P subunit RPR2